MVSAAHEAPATGDTGSALATDLPVIEAMHPNDIPPALRGAAVKNLMDAYEQVNASFGAFAHDTLAASTHAIQSTDETHYNSVEDQIASLTSQRDALVATVRSALWNAAFNGTPISTAQANSWTAQANDLISQAHQLALNS